MAFSPESKENMTNAQNECESIPSPSSLHLLSNRELELMQSITLHRIKIEPEQITLFLLGRVWYRLEHERRRRSDEVRELEQLYFARSRESASRTETAED
jgi:hypothetical protein